jgi:ATP-dependent RNA helicase DDX5/DBP2
VCLAACLAASPPRCACVVPSADHKKPKKLLTFIGKVRGEEKQNGARSKARILIFCNRIKTAKFVESMLRKNNHFCKQMSSAMNQTQRERTLNEFRCGKLPILVATDVAGRGLDVRGLEYVVNYDFPSRLEVYVHRVGRTGRQGAGGHSYSFFGRHLSALVPELIGLLEASGQWVDPNLRTLVPRDVTRVPAVKKSAARHCGQAQGDSSAEDSDSHSSDGLEQWSDSD